MRIIASRDYGPLPRLGRPRPRDHRRDFRGGSDGTGTEPGNELTVPPRVSEVKRGEPACRPGSVRPLARGGGHPSGTAVADSLVRSTREHRAGRPRSLAQGAAGSPLDLAPGGVYRAAAVTCGAGGLLHHRFTLTPALPPGRSVFCGTVPRVTPGRRYRPPCPVEPGPSSPGLRPARPPGRLTRAQDTRVAPGCQPIDQLLLRQPNHRFCFGVHLLAIGERASVTRTPPVPGHTAWMSHPCCSNDMNAASTLYERAAGTHRQSRQYTGIAETPAEWATGTARSRSSKIRLSHGRSNVVKPKVRVAPEARYRCCCSCADAPQRRCLSAVLLTAKYATIWRRETDGRWRLVVGSSGPNP